MTEDDTFRILRRTPAGEAWEAYIAWRLTAPFNLLNGVGTDIFLKEHGWTYKELRNYFYGLKSYD